MFCSFRRLQKHISNIANVFESNVCYAVAKRRFECFSVQYLCLHAIKTKAKITNMADTRIVLAVANVVINFIDDEDDEKNSR